MTKNNFVSLGLIIGTSFFLSAIHVLAQTNSDAAPTFNQKPSAVLDLWENGGRGKYKDYVKLTNATLRQNISFNIYGYEQKNGEWMLIGVAQLKKFCDFDTVNSPWRGRMNEFRWLAVYSPDGFSFNAQALPYRNDITITILENIPTRTDTVKPQPNDSAPISVIQPSIIIDLWENRGKGKYKDYVRLTNSTLRQNIMLNIYGYDQENNQWVIIGPAHLKKNGDTDTVTSPWRGRMNEFRWLLVHSLDGVSFYAQAEFNRNDITIMIMDMGTGEQGPDIKEQRTGNK